MDYTTRLKEFTGFDMPRRNFYKISAKLIKHHKKIPAVVFKKWVIALAEKDERETIDEIVV